MGIYKASFIFTSIGLGICLYIVVSVILASIDNHTFRPWILAALPLAPCLGLGLMISAPTFIGLSNRDKLDAIIKHHDIKVPDEMLES